MASVRAGVDRRVPGDTVVAGLEPVTVTVVVRQAVAVVVLPIAHLESAASSGRVRIVAVAEVRCLEIGVAVALDEADGHGSPVFYPRGS